MPLSHHLTCVPQHRTLMPHFLIQNCSQPGARVSSDPAVTRTQQPALQYRLVDLCTHTHTHTHTAITLPHSHHIASHTLERVAVGMGAPIKHINAVLMTCDHHQTTLTQSQTSSPSSSQPLKTITVSARLPAAPPPPIAAGAALHLMQAPLMQSRQSRKGTHPASMAHGDGLWLDHRGQ